MTHQRRIQDFPDGGKTPKGGAPTYYFAKFRGKPHENEGGREARPKFYYVDPILLEFFL